MYLRRVEGVAKQIAVVKRNDSFKGVKKKKGIPPERVNVPPKMASSRRMRHPEPSIGPYWKVTWSCGIREKTVVVVDKI
ncbi:hypothetical protein CDAR_35661 [Caerostris darwini]|uniref:Uncharacterized protein n=1 Tax=Caerostris darwini TaxID=1538125 RepID=A0AAV4VCH1_9ARAC|nr:hypothetical protein CDAR_35661 [Caerostris darwini]